LTSFSRLRKPAETNFCDVLVYFMREQDDSEFVQQALEGKLESFEVLVERYQKTVYNLALRMVHDSDDAEDIAQTVFLKAFEHLRSYNSRYRFFSWLYRIAMNEALNVIRQKRKFTGLDQVREHAGPGEEFEAAELSRQVQDALMELAVEQRAVVVLRHYEGFSYTEIAQILSISEKKVKSRLFSARQILRDLLERKGLGTV
jgi:RNA polymerase sigma-70 factor (ECF subfamily)